MMKGMLGGETEAAAHWQELEEALDQPSKPF